MKIATRTTCRLCLTRCGMIVESDNGVVTRIVGDKQHPLSRGWLCVKGKWSLEYLNSTSRILYPLRRKGERGGKQWQRISWDEALDDIATRLSAIIQRYGPESVAVQALPPKEYFAYDVFCDIIKSPTFFKHDSHQCFTPQQIADILSFGNLITYPGFLNVEESEVVMLWGVNLHETNPSKDLRVREAHRQGTKLIVVDPRPTKAAKEADLWLRIRPGTDAALALAILNIMIYRNWYNKKFVEEWTEGFSALAERAALYPVEKAADITWIPAEDIEKAAELFGTANTAALYTFIGATMGGNSISTLRLMGFLPALKGVDTLGNNRFLLPPRIRLSRYQGKSSSSLKEARLSRQLSADRFPLLAGPTALTSPYPHPRHVIDAMLKGDPYPVRALWTNCNPLVSIEDTQTVLAALKALDLLVVSEINMSPTASLADYVLPITTHLESDAITEYSGLNLVAARVRAVAPQGEAREEGEIVLELLQRMGYGEKLPVNTYSELLNYRLEPSGLTFEQLKEKGYLLGPDSLEKFKEGRLRGDGEVGFNTPSGKIEFSSRILSKFGYDPLPNFVEPPISPYNTPNLFENYPFILISGTRSLEYYSTLGIDVTKLRKRHPYPTIEMAPETAHELDLKEGDWVEVSAPTTTATIRRKAVLLPGLHPRVMNAEGLWYLPDDDDLIHGTMAVSANVLTPLRDDVDPIIGGSIARCILCNVKRAEIT